MLYPIWKLLYKGNRRVLLLVYSGQKSRGSPCHGRNLCRAWTTEQYSAASCCFGQASIYLRFVFLLIPASSLVPFSSCQLGICQSVNTREPGWACEDLQVPGPRSPSFKRCQVPWYMYLPTGAWIGSLNGKTHSPQPIIRHLALLPC